MSAQNDLKLRDSDLQTIGLNDRVSMDPIQVICKRTISVFRGIGAYNIAIALKTLYHVL